jgi:hypothetical protein
MFDAYKQLYNQKDINFTSYKAQVVNLINREKNARANRQARREALEAKKTAIKEAKKKPIVLPRINKEVDSTIPADFDEWLVGIWRGLAGGDYRRLVIRDDNVILDDIINRGDNYKRDFRPYFASSDTLGYGDVTFEFGDRVLILSPNNVPIVRLRQMFRDGLIHCVFSPIIPRIETSLQNSKTPKSIKRYEQRLAKLKEMEKKWADGVPEEEMEAVARASGFRITINDFLGGELFQFNKGCTNGTLTFRNNRENHLDYINVVSEDVVRNVSEAEMVKLYQECLKKYETEKEHFHFDFLYRGVPKKLYTLNGAYAMKTEDELVKEEFSKSINLMKYRLNAFERPEMNAFARQSLIINATPAVINDDEPTGHLDLDKAYTQFMNYSGYDGFLGVIHEMRAGSFDRAFLEKNIGIYRCTVVYKGLFKKLGVDGVVVLPSVEILYMMDNGCDVYDINMGMWGSRMDFEFTDAMLENKKRYAHWCGMLGMEHPKKRYSFHCSSEWYSHLKSLGYDAYYYDDVCTVKVEKKNLFTYHHIFAFITAYTRINMMEAMKKFREEDLCKVVLDGIYFKGDGPTVDVKGELKYINGLPFKTKQMKIHQYFSKWYDSEGVVFKAGEGFAGNKLLIGQGGSGKTYRVLTDKGYNTSLFVTPQHVLGKDANKEYGVQYTTINKLIGIECTAWHIDNPYPSVIVCDEITQIPAEWIDKIFELYKDSLIILIGDMDTDGMWFQCRGGLPGDYSVMWKPHDVKVVNVEGDRRSRDDLLRDLKLRIRAEMRKVYINGDSGEDVLMKSWAKKNLKTVGFFDAIPMFEEGDTWIAGTHKTNDILLKLGICSGWYKKGGNVSRVELNGYEKRGSYTIHAYQGRTVKEGKIFISIEDMFEFAMLYTAVSRAVNFSQLVFVN